MKFPNQLFRIVFTTLLLTIVFPLLIKAQNGKPFSLVNTSHLDYLYQKIKVGNNEMGIIHIYADYPDFKYVEAKGEGIACVDDAARAEVFYMKYYKLKKDPAVLDKIKMLTNFLLYMQSENGFFNNFIWKDYTIDSTYKTSVAEPNWWTWRAIWTLAEAQNFFSTIDKSYSKEIKLHLDKAVDVTIKWLNKNKSDSTANFGGFNLPTWLPYQTAADQAAILVKGFCEYYKLNKENRVRNEIEKLCKGIVGMQAGNEKTLPYYAFLSWENTWHMWGNSQADALIEAGEVLGKPSYIKSAIKEIKYFYPYLRKGNFVNNFSVVKIDDKVLMKDSSQFSQIAYGIRPMIMACIAAFNSGHDKSDAKMAGELAGWFFGKNPAGKMMYNPRTGVCYDGIISKDELNKNSGAESTIEALISLLEVEQNPIAKKELLKYCKN
jgi:hypothetical protein